MSDNQWHDIKGVLKLRSSSLELAYMAGWSVKLGVSDLLERALREAGLQNSAG